MYVSCCMNHSSCADQISQVQIWFTKIIIQGQGRFEQHFSLIPSSLYLIWNVVENSNHYKTCCAYARAQ